MDTIFINSRNSKTSDLHRLLLKLLDKINLKRSDTYIALPNLSIYSTWKNTKKSYRKTNLKYQLRHAMKNLNCLMVHILYQIFKISLSIS